MEQVQSSVSGDQEVISPLEQSATSMLSCAKDDKEPHRTESFDGQISYTPWDGADVSMDPNITQPKPNIMVTESMMDMNNYVFAGGSNHTCTIACLLKTCAAGSQQGT